MGQASSIHWDESHPNGKGPWDEINRRWDESSQSSQRLIKACERPYREEFHDRSGFRTARLSPGRSTIARRRIIDRTERITEPTEPNLTKNQKIFVSVFRRFFGLQESYRAETLTQDRSRAPRHGEKIEKSAKLPNRPNRSTRSTDRATDRTDRPPP